MDAPASQSLAEALQRRGIALPEDQLACIDRYRALLWDWNSKLNLTRHTTLTRLSVGMSWTAWSWPGCWHPRRKSWTWAAAAACQESCWRYCATIWT